MNGKQISMTVLTWAALSCATPAARAVAQPLRSAAGGYEVEVLVNGAPVPTFFHEGGTWAMGGMGQRYTLRVWNRSSRRVEAVVSVDGRDVIDGKPADFRSKRGYLVPAWGSLDIDDWRLSEQQAAAFRFTTVSDSYAGRTGGARNVGVIGVAIFPERVYVPRPRPLYPDYGRSNKSAEAAPAASAPAAGAMADGYAPRRERPGLGTQFGEELDSQVREVSFTRAHPFNPSVFLGVRYNDHDGLIAMGIDVDGPRYGVYSEPELRRTAEPFPVSERRYSAPPPGWRRD